MVLSAFLQGTGYQFGDMTRTIARTVTDNPAGAVAAATEAMSVAAGWTSAGDGASSHFNDSATLQDWETIPPIESTPRDVEVGPIWSNSEAQTKVEAWISQHSEFAGWRWTGEW